MKKTRILIIGARGFLGSYAVEAVAPKAETVRGDRNASEPDAVALDIRQASSVNDVFASVRPDGVLLLAAIADIDRCEAEPDNAYAVNVRGAEFVARACAQSGARLVFASTGAVFDGAKHGYREEDDVNPISVYGKTKVQAEEIVRNLVPSAAIVRLSLVLGWARRRGTNSILDSLRDHWNRGKAVSFPVNEARNPIHVAYAAHAMTALLLEYHEARGVFHAGSSDAISRYELGRRLAARMSISDELVKPQFEPIRGRAPRGEDHFLIPGKLQKLLGSQAQTCEQVVARCFV